MTGENIKYPVTFLFLVIGFLFCFHSNLFAADVSSDQSVGAGAERFKSGVERAEEQLEKKAKPLPLEISPKEERPVLPSATFPLKEVTITGTTIFQPADFVPIYRGYIDKEISTKDLDAIVKGIVYEYEKKGFLTTNAYIPPQDIKDGRVEIRVVEGKMGNLKIEGNKWFSVGLIKKFFHSKKNQILNINELQRDALRLNSNPDLEVKTIVSAGETRGTSDITLQVKDKFPWHLGFSEDNQGTLLTGKFRTSFMLRCSNLTGNADTLFLDTLFSNGSFGQSANYSIPIGTNGTKLYFDYTFFKMKLGKEFSVNDITGRTDIYTPRMSWELALTEDYQANFNLGLDIKSIIQKQQGQRYADDQLRLPWFGFDFSKLDSTGQTGFSPKFIFGTSGFLGASSRNHPSASRAGTGGSFFKYSQYLNRTQKMFLGSYLSFRSQFQAASHTLPSSEQIQLGGAYSIRGYPEGNYLADMGGFLATDWVFPNYLIPKDWKLANQKTPLRYQVQPVIFFDLGGGKLKKVLPGEKLESFLAGAGGGFLVNFTGISVRLGWAEHFGGSEPVSGAGPSTFYLTFNAEI